ncbi:MAG: lysoplasmalogenase [Anaerolineae bacterium]|nr:lysoplasmalogenase [Anaerolineae bacterium]
MSLIFPAIGVFTLGALLYFGERTGAARPKWILKPLTSALFLLTALAGGPDGTYDWVLFAGLVLCFFGDVFLIAPEPRWFLAGLVTFLLGHVAYIVAFNGLVLVTTLNVVVIALIVLVSVGLFLYFRPHLGTMLAPVVAYIVVITIMLLSAWAVFFGGAEAGLPDTFRYLVAFGATAFYLSDITVARDRFMPDVGFLNRAIGLPLYYVGQFLLALSVGIN